MMADILSGKQTELKNVLLDQKAENVIILIRDIKKNWIIINIIIKHSKPRYCRGKSTRVHAERHKP